MIELKSGTENIPPALCPAIRSYMNDGKGLLAPVGDPIERDNFSIPCPHVPKTRELVCIVFKRESRFRCACGQTGDYWDLEAACRDIDRDQARQKLMESMGIADLDEIGASPWTEQKWYKSKLSTVLKLQQFSWISDGPSRFLDFAALPAEHDDDDDDDDAVEDEGKTLWEAFERSYEIAERTSLLSYYQQGCYAYRSKRSYEARTRRRDRSGESSTWAKEIKTRFNYSRRKADELIRLYCSVEFCWQLAGFTSRKAVLEEVSRRHATSDTITPKDSFNTICVLRDYDRSTGGTELEIKLREGAACILAGRVRTEDIEKNEYISNAISDLLAMFLSAPAISAHLSSFIHQLYELLEACPDIAARYCDVMYHVGLIQLRTSDVTPNWFTGLLDEHVAPTTVPSVSTKKEARHAK